MTNQPLSSADRSFPYWAKGASELPSALKSLITADINEAPWLVLPYEKVGDEPYQEFALRADHNELIIYMAVPVDGDRTIKIRANECCAIQFSNVLLYSEITVFRKARPPFKLIYNAVGERRVQQLLNPFLQTVFSPGRCSIPFEKTPTVMDRLIGRVAAYIPATEKRLCAVQPIAIKPKSRLWSWQSGQAIPAGAVGISGSRIVLSVDGTTAMPGRYGHTTTCVPLQDLQSVDLMLNANQARLRIAFAGDQQMSLLFSDTHKSGVAAVLQEICNRCDATIGQSKTIFPVIAKECINSLSQKVTASASQELMRLTGVDLAEPEALAALREIHKFKWLEAERAGFDTWAVIQPECPLRAAAVHWVRKYFSQFEQNKRCGAIASKPYQIA